MKKWKKAAVVLEIIAAVAIVAEFVVEMIMKKAQPPKNGF